MQTLVGFMHIFVFKVCKGFCTWFVLDLLWVLIIHVRLESNFAEISFCAVKFMLFVHSKYWLLLFCTLIYKLTIASLQGWCYLNSCFWQVTVVTECEVCSMVVCITDYVIKSLSVVLICSVFVYFCVPNTCVGFRYCQISCTIFPYLLSQFGVKPLCAHHLNLSSPLETL